MGQWVGAVHNGNCSGSSWRTGGWGVWRFFMYSAASIFICYVSYLPPIYCRPSFFFTKDQPSATCRRLRNCPPPSLRMRCWSSEPAFQFIPQQTCPPPGILHRIRVQYELRMHLVLNWPDRYPTIYLAGERSFLALNSRGKKGFSKNHIYFSILICFCLFFQISFCSQVSVLRPEFLPYLKYRYNIWQDAGIPTRVAATAVRWATNELHTSLIL